MCLFDNLMYDNLVNVQHQVHSPSPPLIPLPLWLMLFFSQLAPSHQVLILSMQGLYRQPQLLCAYQQPRHTHRAVPVASLHPLTLLGMLPGPGRQVYHAGLSTQQS